MAAKDTTTAGETLVLGFRYDDISLEDDQCNILTSHTCSYLAFELFLGGVNKQI